jgi:hypothetical protein
MTSSGHLIRFPMTCRQMAYDRGMTQVIEMIDELTGNTWPRLNCLYRKQTRRVIRMRKTVKPEIASASEVDGSSGVNAEDYSATTTNDELSNRTTQQQPSSSAGVSQSKFLGSLTVCGSWPSQGHKFNLKDDRHWTSRLLNVLTMRVELFQ